LRDRFTTGRRVVRDSGMREGREVSKRWRKKRQKGGRTKFLRSQRDGKKEEKGCGVEANQKNRKRGEARGEKKAKTQRRQERPTGEKVKKLLLFRGKKRQMIEAGDSNLRQNSSGLKEVEGSTEKDRRAQKKKMELGTIGGQKMGVKQGKTARIKGESLTEGNKICPEERKAAKKK